MAMCLAATWLAGGTLGDTISVTQTGTGQVPITVFDSNLGPLDQVTLQVTLLSGGTAIEIYEVPPGPTLQSISLPAHSHIIDFSFPPTEGLALPDLQLSTLLTGGNTETGPGLADILPVHAHIYADTAMPLLTYTGAELSSFTAPSGDYGIAAQGTVQATGSLSHGHILGLTQWQVETLFEFTPIPEPSALMLGAAGFVGLAGFLRRPRPRND